MEQTHTTAFSEQIAARPPVLRATRELGIRDRDIARLFGVTPGAMGDWAQGTRPIPQVRHAALLFMVARLLGIVGEAPPLPPKHAARLQAARKAAQRWAELARDELSDLPDSVIEAGAELGNEIVEKFEAGLPRRGS